MRTIVHGMDSPKNSRTAIMIHTQNMMKNFLILGTSVNSVSFLNAKSDASLSSIPEGNRIIAPLFYRKTKMDYCVHIRLH